MLLMFVVFVREFCGQNENIILITEQETDWLTDREASGCKADAHGLFYCIRNTYLYNEKDKTEKTGCERNLGKKKGRIGNGENH